MEINFQIYDEVNRQHRKKLGLGVLSAEFTGPSKEELQEELLRATFSRNSLYNLLAVLLKPEHDDKNSNLDRKKIDALVHDAIPDKDIFDGNQMLDLEDPGDEENHDLKNWPVPARRSRR